MSAEGSPEPLLQADEPSVPAEGFRTSHKSYRRKYRKTMVKFEETMRESTSLFKDEQRIIDISRRLAEQNDQILQLLQELNSCPQIPPALRYDLSTSPKDNPVPLKADLSHETAAARKTLQEARQKLRHGEILPAQYREMEQTVLDSPAFMPRTSYSSLLKTPHTPGGPVKEESHDIGSVSLSGCLSSKEEEQYLEGLDSFLSGKSTNPRPHAASGLGARSAERALEREKDLQLRNPVSVYNWLRKHQPQVFLQDNEAANDKAARQAASRASKRASAATATIKQEQDVYADEGTVAETWNATRGKRKREDDPGYRPKGGASRPPKRKKEDGNATSRRGKKSSISGL